MKINTGTKSSINETIQSGQFIVNGSARLFQITTVTDTQVLLTALNGERAQELIMSRSTFVQLFYMKNYQQVSSPDVYLKELSESRRTGATRFLVK